MCVMSGQEAAMPSDEFNAGFLVGVVSSAGVFAIICIFAITGSWERAAIKRGYARYNPSTSVFEWIEKERD